MINYFFGAALAAAPFFIKVSTRTSASLSQDFFLAISTALLVLLFGIGHTHRNIKIMGVSIFLIAFVSKDPFGLFSYYQLCMSFVGVLFLAFVYGNKEVINHKLISNILGAVCVIESLWVISQSLGANPHSYWFQLTGDFSKDLIYSKIPFGSLGNPNHSGALIACLLPFTRWYAYPLAFIALCLGDSAMPVICSVVSLITFYSYSKKNYAPLVASILVLITSAVLLTTGFFNGTFLSDSHRIQAWNKFIEVFGFSFLGKGFGWVPANFSKFSLLGGKFYQLHNEWLEAYAIGGLLGVAVGLYLILPVMKNRGNPAANACLIALLINSLGNFTFHLAPLFMVFAYCYALQLEDKNRV
jgi:hypothetical protein